MSETAVAFSESRRGLGRRGYLDASFCYHLRVLLASPFADVNAEHTDADKPLSRAGGADALGCGVRLQGLSTLLQQPLDVGPE
eukprot:3012075-Rhodomonas_salina.1